MQQGQFSLQLYYWLVLFISKPQREDHAVKHINTVVCQRIAEPQVYAVIATRYELLLLYGRKTNQLHGKCYAQSQKTSCRCQATFCGKSGKTGYAQLQLLLSMTSTLDLCQRYVAAA